MSGVLEFAVVGQSDQRVSKLTPLPVSYTDAAGNAVGGPSNPEYAKGATYNFLGHQQILTGALASSQALPSVPATATTAFIQNIGTGAANMRIDGATTPPTASGPGIVIAPGATFTCDFGQTALTTARVIQVAAGAALQITYMA